MTKLPTAQDKGASATEADRAATPSGPSPEEVSGSAGIPCAFTPGPWLTREHCPPAGYKILVEDKDGRNISLCNYGRASDQFTVPQEEAFANARLIAAAPELCEVAGLWVEYDAMLRRYSGPQTILFNGDAPEIDAAYDRVISATVAALAKARGNG